MTEKVEGVVNDDCKLFRSLIMPYTVIHNNISSQVKSALIALLYLFI